MAKSYIIKSDLLRPLSAISVIQNGTEAYFRELRRNNDPFIAVAAWCGLLDNKAMSMPLVDEALPFARYNAIRSRLFNYLHGIGERDLARKVALTDVAAETAAHQQAMLADLDHDFAQAAEAAGALYLASGEPSYLNRASNMAELAGGWRDGLAWTVRSIAASPFGAAGIVRLYALLESSAQPELLEEAAELFAARNLYLQVGQVFRASAALVRKNPQLALDLLKPFTDEKINDSKALQTYRGTIYAHRAEAEERLGNFKKAYEGYIALNAFEKSTEINPEHYYRGVEARNRLEIPKLPPDSYPHVVQMLGFPRSGTTLLENVLAAHPMIETFEEIPALTATIDRIEQVMLKKRQPEPPEATFAAARTTYFTDMLSRRKKPDANVLVDKMPIRSAEAAFIGRLFPEWRYVFSIRHPFDVVLSCFKQRFAPNTAMENFRTIEQSARIYDFAMTQWFANHTMADPNVHYVRYDDLVTDFEPTAKAAFDFLGVPWDDAVRDFSTNAEKRAAKTPSYMKVRQGLSIGVQSSWKKYGFVFQSDATKPLKKWAEFFGYPTE